MTDIRDMKVSDLAQTPEAKLGEYVLRVQLARRVGEVNVSETIELITRAKGPRSMRKFADDLGVNVSSLSRILNGSVTELRAAMLAKIAFYADKQSGVTIEKLMKAQGLSDPQEGLLSGLQFERECRRIIVDSLIQHGFTVKGLKVDANHPEQDFRFDIELVTDALKDGSGVWAFECKYFNRYGNALPVGSGRTMAALDRVLATYYVGLRNFQRISLVVDHPIAFQQLQERLSGLKLPNEVSVILINVDKGIVEDEFVAPLTGSGDPNAVFNKIDN